MNINFAKLWAGQRGEASPVRLVGVRGWNDPDDQNFFARYDDAIFVLLPAPGPDMPLNVSPWTASTDPSWALVVHPINENGAAQLCEGSHLFGRHLMHGKFACFGQAEDVHVNRLNANGTLNHVDFGQFGICIHSGGDGMDTRRFSAGCQIIQNPDGYFGNPTWLRFYDAINNAMKQHQIDTFPYLLASRAHLEAGGFLF